MIVSHVPCQPVKQGYPLLPIGQNVQCRDQECVKVGDPALPSSQNRRWMNTKWLLSFEPRVWIRVNTSIRHISCAALLARAGNVL